MLVLHPAPTCVDAGPDICTLHPDFCTVYLQWLSLAATYNGVAGVSPSTIGSNTPLAHVAVSPIATCAYGVFLPPTGADTVFALGQLALCGGGILIQLFYFLNIKFCNGSGCSNYYPQTLY